MTGWVQWLHHKGTVPTHGTSLTAACRGCERFSSDITIISEMFQLKNEVTLIQTSVVSH